MLKANTVYMYNNRDYKKITHKRYNDTYSEVWLYVVVITSLKLINGECCHVCVSASPEYHVLLTVMNELSQEHN